VPSAGCRAKPLDTHHIADMLAPPNPADGTIFFVEPSRPLAATILQNAEELTSPPMRDTLFAIAAVLLCSAAMLSFVGWAIKQPMKRYGGRA